jgi:hypothetical protein
MGGMLLICHLTTLAIHPEAEGMLVGIVLTEDEGAVLHDMPKDDEPSSLDFAGSTFVLSAENKEEVIEHLKGDIYARSGVWDVDNVSIRLSGG